MKTMSSQTNYGPVHYVVPLLQCDRNRFTLLFLSDAAFKSDVIIG